MALPLVARQRLAELLTTPPLRMPERVLHTLPVGQTAWRRHRDALVQAMEDFNALLVHPEGDFEVIRSWAHELTRVRKQVQSLLLALEPFIPFEGAAADNLARTLDELIVASADNLIAGTRRHGESKELRGAISWWRDRDSEYGDSELLRIAFGVPDSPVDDRNEFRADWVFQQYAYRNSDVIVQVLRHLDSLGIPEVTDVLAGISVVGGLLDCDDPVTAYVAMDSFVNSYLEAPPELAAAARSHLDAGESALRRARQMANRAYNSAVSSQDDSEARALALADMYKRIAEGPFRQYAWTLHCLQHGEWSAPPMLGALRERLIAEKGYLSAVADNVVLPDLRNSETHETLEWDGIEEEFVTEAGRMSLSRVAVALIEGESFTAGCEAGMTAVRTLHIQPDGLSIPDPSEEGRMPAWRRVRAYFGTNNLRLVEERLNARNALLRVEQLRLRDVNPCFQALLTAHRLLPRIETFSVETEDDAETNIVVSADALEATMPIWKFALANLDRMPFATFLPANLDARQRVEPERVAVRSAAWIAADDVLDAIDGSPPSWDESVLKLLDARLHVADLAVSQTAAFVGSGDVRIESLHSSIKELRDWINRLRPSDSDSLEELEALRRLRLQWSSWGPVRRHPLVPEPPDAEFSEHRPMIRQGQFSKPYRTI